MLGVIIGLVSLPGCVGIDGGQESRNDQLDEQGTIEIFIDGDPVDLTQDRFQVEYQEDDVMAFHLHEDDEYWYMEGEERLTVGNAIDHLPHFQFDHEEGHHVIAHDGTVYDGRAAETEITVFVNSEMVDPTDYELRDGDHLRVEITIAS